MSLATTGGRDRDQHSKQPVRFAVWARGEEQSVLWAIGRAAMAEGQAPETIDLYGYAIGTVQRASVLEFSFPVQLGGIERMDASVPEIANQQMAAELAEVLRCQRHSPGRIQLPLLSDTLEEGALCVEHVDVPVSLARYIVMCVSILQGVSHENDIVEGLDAEWCISAGYGRVCETAMNDIEV